MSGTLRFVTPRNASEIIQLCHNAGIVALDTETTALHPKDGKLRLIQVAIPGYCFVLDAFQYDPTLLAPLFDGQSIIIGHNLGFDLRFLWSVGIRVPDGRKLFDTMVAGQLLDAGLFPRPSHALAAMVDALLGEKLSKTEQTSDWSGVLSLEQLQYAARDATILLPLHESLKEKIRSASLQRTMQLEMRALPGLVWCTMSGIPVDREGWHTLASANAIQVENLECALAIETNTQNINGFSLVNWRSTQQVQEVFNKKFVREGKVVREKRITLCQHPRCLLFNRDVCEYHSEEYYAESPFTIDNADDETLTGLAVDGDGLAKLLLKYRKSVKSRDTYGHKWADQFIHTDGRVYSDYRQIGAYSGRMSCTNPNCQQVPHSHAFRTLFRPESGKVFIIVDYSQIELRITTDISKDPVAMQAYCVDNTDLHIATAELILGADLRDTSEANLKRIKEARQVAKSLNFGLIFGAGSETMRKYALSAFGVNLTPQEATRLRNAWRKTYNGIVEWQRKVQDGVETVWTLGGRRRLNVDKFTEKLNTPVQGTGADGLKAGIALCYERMHMIFPQTKLVAIVHDELVFEAPIEHADAVAHWAKANMEEGMSAFMKNVPAVASPIIAASWADK